MVIKISKRLILTSLIFLLIGGLFVAKPFSVRSASCEDSCDDKSDNEKLSCLTEVKQACEAKLSEISQEKQTLQNAIAYYDTQIALTQSKINETIFQIDQLEEEITELTGKISLLNASLEITTNLLLERIAAIYKQTKIHPLAIFFSSNGITDLINRYRYLRAVQVNDRRVLFDLEKTRANYDAQKTLKEEKQGQVLGLQTELIGQKTTLNNQQQEKENLLEVTKNNEARYQELLKQAQREIESLANSEFVGKQHVSRGEVIGLMGNTGFSTGPHLHFGYFGDVNEGQVDDVHEWYFSKHRDPTSFLQGRNVYIEPQSCDGESGGERNVGSGGRPWPLDNPRITQCYGHTPFSYVYPDNYHRGLDMADGSGGGSGVAIKAAEEGEAHFYRGTSSFGNNVRVLHSDGTMTLYLHMQ